MNLNAVMDDLAVGLNEIEALRVFPYWPGSISPPTAIIQWPERLDYDAAFARGLDTADFLVSVLVGKADARSAQDALAAYCDGSGDSSIKVAVEDHEPTAYDSARVQSVTFEVISVASVEYLAATFIVNIVGSGA